MDIHSSIRPSASSNHQHPEPLALSFSSPGLGATTGAQGANAASISFRESLRDNATMYALPLFAELENDPHCRVHSSENREFSTVDI